MRYPPAMDNSLQGPPMVDMLLPTMDMLLPGPPMVDMLLWICSFKLWICPCQDLLWWICSYGHAPPSYGYDPARTPYGGYVTMDMLFPAMVMLLPGSPNVDMLPSAMNTLLSEPTTADTSFVTEGYAGWAYLSQHNQQYNRTGLFSFKREYLIYDFISQANILFLFTLIKSKELWAAHYNE